MFSYYRCCGRFWGIVTCVVCACPASHSLGSTAKHSETGRWHPVEGVVMICPHRWPWLAACTKCCSDWGEGHSKN